MQRALNNQGYNAGTADGIFGRRTLIAVKNVQAQKGLTVDGKVGKNTCIAIGGKWTGK